MIIYGPVRTIADTVPHLHRTLAGELLRWSARAFRLDWTYTPEQCRILACWYELRDDAVPEGDSNDPETWGRVFRHESGTLRRLKAAPAWRCRSRPPRPETSQPLLRMVWMTAGMVVSEVIGEVPPQAGVQLLPWARTNASWKAFCPVASIIAAASGGLLSSGIR
ncbi:hypothetical protein [Kitasatospora griseola]|uniref:hypothetical protein n=1 Tax=Kitasatospora griseola TaxID=2064 RepID=UPI001670CF73|nr:hypothetical protein GCM10010195_50880 [Kitasatospora griseola]